MKAKSWLQFFKHPFKVGFRVVGEFTSDDGPFIAAGIAFYAFFSIFPLALISVAVLSYLYTESEAIKGTVSLAGMFLPDDMVRFLDEHIQDLFQKSDRIGLTGLLILLWSGRQLFRAMELALHRAWNIELKRTWLVGNLLAMMLVLLCTAVVLGVGAISLFLSWVEVQAETLDVPQPLQRGWTLADTYLLSNLHSWVVVPAAVALIFLLLYILLPSTRVPVSMAVPGAVFSSVAWRVSSWIYLTYIMQFGSANPFFGTIWSIVGLLVWLYIEATVFMLGAELVFVMMDSKDRAILGSSDKKSKKK